MNNDYTYTIKQIGKQVNLNIEILLDNLSY